MSFNINEGSYEYTVAIQAATDGDTLGSIIDAKDVFVGEFIFVGLLSAGDVTLKLERSDDVGFASGVTVDDKYTSPLASASTIDSSSTLPTHIALAPNMGAGRYMRVTAVGANSATGTIGVIFRRVGKYSPAL